METINTRGCADAQRMELRDRFRRAHRQKTQINPGDIVAFEPGLGRISPPDNPPEIVFWAWLDFSLRDHDQLFRDCSEHVVAVPGIDCIVAIISHDGATLNFFIAASTHLMVVETYEGARW